MTQINSQLAVLLTSLAFLALIIYDCSTIQVNLAGWKILFAFAAMCLIAVTMAFFIFLQVISRGGDEIPFTIAFAIAAYLLLTRLMMWTF